MADSAPRILVVDAEPDSSSSVREALDEASIRSEVAESGAEALRRVGDPAVCVVMLDLQLPDTTGLEVLHRIREERPELRVIVLSAPGDQDDVLEALRLGACDYLAKPLHREELVLSAQRAIEAHATESRWATLCGRMCALGRHLADLGRDAEGDVGDFASRAASATAEVLGASKTSLMLLDETGSQLRVVAATGPERTPEQMDPVPIGDAVAGLVLASGEPAVVGDVQSDARFSDRLRGGYESSSLVIAPVPGERGPLGVLCATDREAGDPFGEEDLALLRIVALQVGPALARRMAPADPPETGQPLPPASEGCDDAELARAICESLTAEVEPELLLGAALRAAGRRIPAAPVSLYLVDPRSGHLMREGDWAGDGSEDREYLPARDGLTGVVHQTGSLVATEHPEADPRFAADVDTLPDGKPRPLVCAPLRLRGKVLGVVRAFPRPGAPASARTGEVMAAGLSAAVRNMLLYRSLLESVDEVARVRRESRRSR